MGCYKMLRKEIEIANDKTILSASCKTVRLAADTGKGCEETSRLHGSFKEKRRIVRNRSLSHPSWSHVLMNIEL